MWDFVGKCRGRTDFRVKNACKFAPVLWGVMRAKKQVRSVTYRACRLEPGCETQYIALTGRVIQAMTRCCTISRNDSVFLHLTASAFHLIAHYLTSTTAQRWMYACVFVHCWTHLLKTCLALSLAVVSLMCPFTCRPLARPRTQCVQRLAVFEHTQICVTKRGGYVLRNASLGNFVVVQMCTYTNLERIVH
jgi:hypothetical protein